MITVCAAQVSDRAKKRGKTQLGTLGAGNHYVEVQARPLLTSLPVQPVLYTSLVAYYVCSKASTPYLTADCLLA